MKYSLGKRKYYCCIQDGDVFVTDNQLNLELANRHSLLVPGHLISVQIFITEYIR